jgi:hypothetical protein
MTGNRFILGLILSLALVFFSWTDTQTAQATSCGPAEHSAPPFAGFEPTVLDLTITTCRVSSTGSTYFAYTPGIQISLDDLVSTSWTDRTWVYFYSQIPIAHDPNNNLSQGTSFILGLPSRFS